MWYVRAISVPYSQDIFFTQRNSRNPYNAMQYYVLRTFHIPNVQFRRSYYARQVQSKCNVRFRAKNLGKKNKPWNSGRRRANICWANKQSGRSPGAEPLNRISFSSFGLNSIPRPKTSINPWEWGKCYSGIGRDSDFRLPILVPPRCFRCLLIANFPGLPRSGHVVENRRTGEVQIEGIDLQVFPFLFCLYSTIHSTFSNLSALYCSSLPDLLHTHTTYIPTSIELASL